MTVARSTLIPACLPGGMEDQDVHNIIQVPLDDGSVLATGLVGSFDAAPAPVCPVNVILVLSQAKGVRQVISYNLTVKACLQKWKGEKKQNYVLFNAAGHSPCTERLAGNLKSLFITYFCNNEGNVHHSKDHPGVSKPITPMCSHLACDSQKTIWAY